MEVFLVPVNRLLRLKRLEKKIESYLKHQSKLKMTGVFSNESKLMVKNKKIIDKSQLYLKRYFLNQLTRYMFVAEQRGYEKKAEIIDLENMTADEMNTTVARLIRRYTVNGFLKGGGAAIAGLPVTVIETITSIKSLWQQITFIGICYGFKPYSYFEKIYLLKLMSIALCSDPKRRIELYNSLIELEKLMSDPNIPLKNQENYFNSGTLVDETVDTIFIPFIFTKLSQTIPIIGFGVGSLTNAHLTKQVLNLSCMVYERRFLKNEQESL